LNWSEVFGLQIVTYPHPALRHKSKPLRRVDAEIREVIGSMFELMYAHRGVGLAANQVDLPFRLFVMNLEGELGKGEELVFINPVISHPKGTEERDEGCLSLPELYAPVIRPKRVKIQAYGLDGGEITAEADGLFARCVQHEVDHLDGVLFIDRVNPTLAPELATALDEFETDFHSRRATGGIPSDEEIVRRLAALERKYC
jgi:peptide deformylase